MGRNVFLGSDPDIHNLSLVAIDDDCKIVGVWMIKEKGSKGSEAVRQMNTLGLSNFLTNGKGLELLDEVRAFAVEGQNVAYTAGTGANPQCIVDLSAVAGAVISILHLMTEEAESYFPKPSAWKGTVPKHVVQYRAMRTCGIEYDKNVTKNKQYPIPHKEGWQEFNFGPSKINNGDWEDIADSVGLALWARDQWHKNNKQKRG